MIRTHALPPGLRPALHLPLLALLALAACSSGAGKVQGDGTGTADPDTDIPSEGHDSGEPEIDPDQRADNLASQSGDFALDYLRAAPYDRVVVEVDYVAGQAPDAAALTALQETLERLCDKPGGVEIVIDDEIPAKGSPEWTVNATEELEIAWRDRYRDPDSGTAALYYLYLDGNSALDEGGGYVLGYAYHGSSLIMFKERIEQAGGPLPLLGGVEDTVIVHELGHILGLVNNGVPMVEDHQDTEHGHHDDSDSCIMYWAVETDGVADILTQRVPDFDAACLADLAAARAVR